MGGRRSWRSRPSRLAWCSPTPWSSPWTGRRRAPFDASVGDVAWVLISFNLVLAFVALPAAPVVQRCRARWAWRAGLVVFAVTSLLRARACPVGPGGGPRRAGAAGENAVVAATLERPMAGVDTRRAIALWGAAGMVSAAVGATTWRSWWPGWRSWLASAPRRSRRSQEAAGLLFAMVPRSACRRAGGGRRAGPSRAARR